MHFLYEAVFMTSSAFVSTVLHQGQFINLTGNYLMVNKKIEIFVEMPRERFYPKLYQY